MRGDHRAIETLNQMRRLSQPRKHCEVVLKRPSLAHHVEPILDAVPVAISLRQGPPSDVVDCEVVKRFKKNSVASRHAPCAESFQSQIPICFVKFSGHPQLSANS